MIREFYRHRHRTDTILWPGNNCNSFVIIILLLVAAVWINETWRIRCSKTNVSIFCFIYNRETKEKNSNKNRFVNCYFFSYRIICVCTYIFYVWKIFRDGNCTTEINHFFLWNLDPDSLCEKHKTKCYPCYV